jgi:hypothetical protein
MFCGNGTNKSKSSRNETSLHLPGQNQWVYPEVVAYGCVFIMLFAD